MSRIVIGLTILVALPVAFMCVVAVLQAVREAAADNADKAHWRE